MMMGLVSGLSLASHSDSESFLVAQALLIQDGCQQEGFWEVVRHVVSPFDLSWTLPVQFSRSVMSNSLRPHELQYTRLPCPSPALGAWSNSGPSSRWCHSTISSSVVSFSHLQSFPASGSFPVIHFFTSGGQNIGVSTSVLPMNIQDWFPLHF